jgi:hypothetical protein
MTEDWGEFKNRFNEGDIVFTTEGFIGKVYSAQQGDIKAVMWIDNKSVHQHNSLASPEGVHYYTYRHATLPEMILLRMEGKIE